MHKQARWWALCGVLWAEPGAAQQSAAPAQVVLSLSPAGPLPLGSRALLRVVIAGFTGERLPPLLLTATALGDAVEVLRGRALASDAAKAPDGGWLFELPLRALARGSAEIGVSVDAALCDPRCRDVHLAARIALDVRPP
jgi:hypothetical protein